MEAAYSTLLSRPVFGGMGSEYQERTKALAKDGKEHPRIITLGGDHTIVRFNDLQSLLFHNLDAFSQVLPILRSLHKVYGPVSVCRKAYHLCALPNPWLGHPFRRSSRWVYNARHSSP